MTPASQSKNTAHFSWVWNLILYTCFFNQFGWVLNNTFFKSQTLPRLWVLRSSDPQERKVCCSTPVITNTLQILQHRDNVTLYLVHLLLINSFKRLRQNLATGSELSCSWLKLWLWMWLLLRLRLQLWLSMPTVAVLWLLFTAPFNVNQESIVKPHWIWNCCASIKYDRSVTNTPRRSSAVSTKHSKHRHGDSHNHSDCLCSRGWERYVYQLCQLYLSSFMLWLQPAAVYYIIINTVS